MADPILFVVDDDAETLASLAAALQRRFGADYRILTDRSPVSALARLEQSRQQGESGTNERLAGTALFVLIGAGPHTSWLAKTIQRDEEGYILTGSSVIRSSVSEPAWPLDRAPHALETSMPGVFAAGDVRHRSPRGVAAAVADGAIAIRSVREYLAAE